MDTDAASGLPHASTDFEQACTEGFNLGRAPGLRQLQAEEVDQVVGQAVQQQTEGVGQEAVTAQAIGAEAVLQLLDTVLTFATIIVESKDVGSPAGTVGDDKAQIGPGSGVFGLVADAALA